LQISTENILAKNKGCNNTRIAFIADRIPAICNTSYPWKTLDR